MESEATANLRRQIKAAYAAMVSGEDGGANRLIEAGLPLTDIIACQRSSSDCRDRRRLDELAAAGRLGLVEAVNWLDRALPCERPSPRMIKTYLSTAIGNAIKQEAIKLSQPLGCGPDAKTIMRQNKQPDLSKWRRGRSRKCIYCKKQHWVNCSWTAIKRGSKTIGYACKSAFDDPHNENLRPGKQRLIRLRGNMDLRPAAKESASLGEVKAAELLQDILSVCVNKREESLVLLSIAARDGVTNLHGERTNDEDRLGRILGLAPRTIQTDLKRLRDRRRLFNEILAG